ncbi:hypothetical protein ACSMFR_02260 [Listeria aquatica]|uniref:hypothetical protein n=1 Tax=Listeria aquatica TaxID=1494960 RepID=UPI003F6FFE2F
MNNDDAISKEDESYEKIIRIINKAENDGGIINSLLDEGVSKKDAQKIAIFVYGRISNK